MSAFLILILIILNELLIIKVINLFSYILRNSFYLLLLYYSHKECNT